MKKKSSIYAMGQYVKNIFSGKKDEPPREGKFLSGYREDYETDIYYRKLTPYKLGVAMRDAAEGDTSAQYEIFEVVEQDPHVTAVTTKRRDSLLHLPFEIRPGVPQDGSEYAKKAREAADLCRDIIFGSDRFDGIYNWYDGLFDLSDAICKGFSVSQIVWRQDSGKWIIDRLERWPQRECQLGDPSKIYQQDQDEVRIITDRAPYVGEIPTPNQWVIFRRKSYSQPLARAALFRAITWSYLLKNFSMKDWSIFIERYGMPLRVGKFPAGASDTDILAIKNAVSSMGKDAYCVIPDGAAIEFITADGAAGRATIPYPQMAQFCNDEISKAVLGNTMTAEQGNRGARSLGEVYERAELKLTKSDAIMMQHALRMDLLKPLTYLNLGTDYPVPEPVFIIGADKDLKERAETLSLISSMGVAIKQDQVREEFNLEKPEEGDELIGSPVQDEDPEKDAPDPREIEKSAEMAIKEAENMLSSLRDEKK